MPRFRKKPVVIEAHNFLGCNSDGDPIFDTDPTGWLLEAMSDEKVDWAGRELTVYTLEGCHIASVGDWIVRGVKGELYPVKPDIFAATYEAVE